MSPRPHGPRSDPRFTLHHAQPRADKLTIKQRRLCSADPAFLEALRMRVASAARFSAFLAGAPFYVALERPCARCRDFRKRTRDRSCYRCHLNRGGENFEFIKAGLRPVAKRSRESHLDLLERRRAERNGEHMAAEFGRISVRRFPTGRLEVTFPDGFIEPDLADTGSPNVQRLVEMLPELNEALIWAGWY